MIGLGYMKKKKYWVKFLDVQIRGRIGERTFQSHLAEFMQRQDEKSEWNSCFERNVKSDSVKFSSKEKELKA